MSDEKKDVSVTVSLSELEDLLTKNATAVAVAMENRGKAATAEKKDAAHAKKSKGQCPDCRQLNMACKGKHRMLTVMPKVNAEWFKGCFINGVQYLSDKPIAVPADCDIEYQLGQWERNEYEAQHGRKRVRNSGSIGPSGAGVRPLNPDDFFR